MNKSGTSKIGLNTSQYDHVSELILTLYCKFHSINV